ncbi:fimbrial protein [Salmonella enterica]|nr:fimbrial protein [Salmonella enterica]EAO9907385.1 fimbrial protein [Salmonella enterica]EAR8965031.1 fimbrial protein [Salmonella enterica]EBN3599808.1 fimbrial protein [Salmonella enterica]ECX9538919.1 fimbrial protein [Salmonella enterica]
MKHQGTYFMKKTLIAFTVAVSALSGTAQAWTSGDFKGSFDINGTIIAESANNKWEWMVGEGLFFEKNSKEMTEGNTKLTITQATPAPILLGRTKEAFAARSVGVGAIPLISFSDYDGQLVSLQSSGTNKGYFELPMKDDEGNKLGNVKVNVTSVGLLSKTDMSDTGFVLMHSLASYDNSHIYYGGLPGPSVHLASTASSIIGKFTDNNHTALFEQIKKVRPEATLRGQSEQGWVLSSNMVDTTGEVMASSYALGIDQGQTIEATFTDPVVKTTQWSAPLNVAVTYN